MTSFRIYYASNHLNGKKSHNSLKTRSIFAQVNTQIIKVFLKVGDNVASLNICCPTFRGVESFSGNTTTIEDETNTFFSKRRETDTSDEAS